MMTATTTTAEIPTTERSPGRLRRVLASITTRLLLGYILLLAFATLSSILLVREVLLSRLDERIDAELAQEGRELRKLAGGNDPETGDPFGGDVERIFEVFLERNIPSQNETMVAFVDGRPRLRSARPPPYRIDEDRELVARWANIDTTDRGRVDTPAGTLEHLAVPIMRGGTARGVFVVGIFRDIEAGEVNEAVRVSAGIGAIMLLIGSVLAVGVARRVIRPVDLVASTARSISESDLTRRIPVSGHDEISALAQTFNEMLDRLETAFATQRSFVDDAGHELRTPITIVRGHLEVMVTGSDQQRETVALVLDELDRMSRIVDELLVLAKAEQPDFLKLETVDLATLTSEIYAKAKALGDREWRLENVGVGRVVGDRQRLTQAVMQLAQNASQHTAEGAGIGLGSNLEDGVARLWVRDSGPGVALEDRGRIFERFARSADGRRPSEGAGLGLSIVRAIAEAHHGRVELDSRLGNGSTFTLVLPVDQPTARDERALV